MASAAEPRPSDFPTSDMLASGFSRAEVEEFVARVAQESPRAWATVERLKKVVNAERQARRAEVERWQNAGSQQASMANLGASSRPASPAE